MAVAAAGKGKGAASAAATTTAPGGAGVVGLFADEPHGIFLVRGENVLLLGEIDLDLDDEPPPGYERGELEVVKKLAKERREEEARRHKKRLKALGRMGFEGESMGEVLF